MMKRLINAFFFKRWLVISLLVAVCYEAIWIPLDIMGEDYNAIYIFQCVSIDLVECLFLSFFNTLFLAFLNKIDIKQSLLTGIILTSMAIVVINIVVSVPLSFLERSLYVLISDVGQGDSVDSYYNYIDMYVLGSIGVIITVCNLLLLQSEQLIKKNRLLADVEIKALRNQINPHFLFNNLNIGIALIGHCPTKAVSFFTLLAKVYRIVLENAEKRIHTLKEEYESVGFYLELLAIRFGNAVNVHWDLSEDDYDRAIMCGCLQLLVENAIKHNRFSEEEPLDIAVECKGNILVVSNEIRPLTGGEDGLGKSQEIIKNSYIDLCFKAVAFRQEGRCYRVEIPLLDYDYIDNRR